MIELCPPAIIYLIFSYNEHFTTASNNLINSQKTIITNSIIPRINSLNLTFTLPQLFDFFAINSIFLSLQIKIKITIKLK